MHKLNPELESQIPQELQALALFMEDLNERTKNKNNTD